MAVSLTNDALTKRLMEEIFQGINEHSPPSGAGPVGVQEWKTVFIGMIKRLVFQNRFHSTESREETGDVLMRINEHLKEDRPLGAFKICLIWGQITEVKVRKKLRMSFELFEFISCCTMKCAAANLKVIDITEPLDFSEEDKVRLKSVLKGYKNLTCLRVTSNGFLLDLPETLKHLHVSFCKGITEDNVDQIRDCVNLEYLHIFIFYRDYFLHDLLSRITAKPHPSLRSIFLYKFEIDYFDHRVASGLCRNLKFLKNFGVRVPSGRGFDGTVFTNTLFSHLSSLEFLHLEQVKYLSDVLPPAVQGSYRFDFLQHLVVNGCRALDERLFTFMISGMPLLHYLSLQHSNTSLRGLLMFLYESRTMRKVCFYSPLLETNVSTSDMLQYFITLKLSKHISFCLCKYQDRVDPYYSNKAKSKIAEINNLLATHFRCDSHLYCLYTCTVYRSEILRCGCY